MRRHGARALDRKAHVEGFVLAMMAIARDKRMEREGGDLSDLVAVSVAVAFRAADRIYRREASR